MILVDTSVWADHLRASDRSVNRLLDDKQVVMHPFVLGEIALGYLDPRADILEMLQSLPKAEVADDSEVLQFIDQYQLFGTGVGYVDTHLLTAAMLTFSALWTRDKRLQAVAERLGIAASGLK